MAELYKVGRRLLPAARTRRSNAGEPMIEFYAAVARKRSERYSAVRAGIPSKQSRANRL